MTSLAEQSEAELGGRHSVLMRQKRDHIELDRLINAVEQSHGVNREQYVNQLCRLVFRLRGGIGAVAGDPPIVSPGCADDADHRA